MTSYTVDAFIIFSSIAKTVLSLVVFCWVDHHKLIGWNMYAVGITWPNSVIWDFLYGHSLSEISTRINIE